jgi:hypothetical protein
MYEPKEMQLITIKASPYLILIMDRSLLQMVFCLVLAVASAGMTAKSAKLIREKSRKLLILYSVETGASEQTYFEFSWIVFLLQMVFWLVLAVASASASPPGPRRSPPGPFSAFPASNYPSFLEEITFDEPGRRKFREY